MKTKTNVKAGLINAGAAASGSVAAAIDVLGLAKISAAASFNAAAAISA